MPFNKTKVNGYLTGVYWQLVSLHLNSAGAGFGVNLTIGVWPDKTSYDAGLGAMWTEDYYINGQWTTDLPLNVVRWAYKQLVQGNYQRDLDKPNWFAGLNDA